MKQLVSIRQPITEAIERTSEDHMALFPTLISWAKKAEEKIGSPYSYEEDIVVLQVNNYKARLPIATTKVVAIVDGDKSGIGREAFFNRWRNYTESVLPYMGEDVIFRWNVADASWRPCPIKWKVIDNTIVFEVSPMITVITVLLNRFKIDEEGLPMVNSTHVEAIANYLKWRLAELEQYKRFRKMKLTHVDNNYTRELKENWINARDAARGDDIDTSEDQIRIVSEMLNHPLSGDGILGTT
jgi:hypothetical protein